MRVVVPKAEILLHAHVSNTASKQRKFGMRRGTRAPGRGTKKTGYEVWVGQPAGAEGLIQSNT